MQPVQDVLRRCAENGITLHPGKFVLGTSTVSCCGFRLSGSGYTVDDHLVKALTHFSVPGNRTDIRSFCRLVQQFQSFSPRLTELLALSEHSCRRSPSSPGRPLTKRRSSKSSANWPALEFWRTSCPAIPCAWKLMPHSRKVSERTCGSSNHPVTGAFYNAAPATLPQQNRDTPKKKWNSWPLCGPPKKPTSTSQRPTSNSLSTTGHSSHFSARRQSMRCHHHD